MCDIPNSYVGHAQFPCVTCFIRTCDMTHLYVWHASCVGRITWEIHIITHNDRPVMNAWVMTHSFVWHASSLHAMTGLIHMCNMTFRHVWQASLICVTQIFDMRNAHHWTQWQASFINVIASGLSSRLIMWISHIEVSCHTNEWDMSLCVMMWTCISLDAMTDHTHEW